MANYSADLGATLRSKRRALLPACRLVLLVLSVGLSCCYLSAQEAQTLILRGTIVTPEEIIDDGIISISGEKITDVRKFNRAKQGDIVDTGSFIVPGLIDLHDHITWNLLPRWRSNHQFVNRYEWQEDTAYEIALATPHRKLAEEGLGCAANLYGEIKAIVNGATSVVGSLPPSEPGDNKCIAGNARNLDFYSGFYGNVLNQERLRNEVFPFEISFEDAANIRSELASGKLTAFIVHLAEGKPTDASSAREFKMLDKQGFVRAGVIIDHGLAFRREQFRVMANRSMGLVWSPRSNIELYGTTTDVLTAKQEGVPIALAPDWSPSGSDGMLEELRYAATWNAGQSPSVFGDAELLKMATVIPARLARLDDKIGSLKPGLYADILLIKRKGDAPFYAVTHSGSADVRLVMVNGVPVYGDLDLMSRLLPPEQIEPIRICGKEKSLHIEKLRSSSGIVLTWKVVSETLNESLKTWGSSLAELSPCEGTNQH